MLTQPKPKGRPKYRKVTKNNYECRWKPTRKGSGRSSIKSKQKMPSDNISFISKLRFKSIKRSSMAEKKKDISKGEPGLRRYIVSRSHNKKTAYRSRANHRIQ